MCRNEFGLYFDMNGGFAKIQQRDVAAFFRYCEEANSLIAESNDAWKAVVTYDRLFHALLLCRWSLLQIAISQGWSKEEWLFYQIGGDIPGDMVFEKCLEVKKK